MSLSWLIRNVSGSMQMPSRLSVHDAHRTSDPLQSERLLEEAATLYAGEFLPEERTLSWTTNSS